MQYVDYWGGICQSLKSKFIYQTTFFPIKGALKRIFSHLNCMHHMGGVSQTSSTFLPEKMKQEYLE